MCLTNLKREKYIRWIVVRYHVATKKEIMSEISTEVIIFAEYINSMSDERDK